MQYYKYLLYISFLANKGQIGCLDILQYFVYFRSFTNSLECDSKYHKECTQIKLGTNNLL